MESKDLETFFGSAFGMIILVGLGVLVLLTILMPVAVFLIHNDVRNLERFAQTREKEQFHQTKLLTEIRDALRSMEAVGVETEQSPEPEPTLASVAQSIGPRRHQIRG